jgi:hypothetical protein
MVLEVEIVPEDGARRLERHAFGEKILVVEVTVGQRVSDPPGSRQLSGEHHMQVVIDRRRIVLGSAVVAIEGHVQHVVGNRYAEVVAYQRQSRVTSKSIAIECRNVELSCTALVPAAKGSP